MLTLALFAIYLLLSVRPICKGYEPKVLNVFIYLLTLHVVKSPYIGTSAQLVLKTFLSVVNSTLAEYDPIYLHR